ncbi:hypothetical protein JAAARDRAFT_196595 [Jaapia argillacea MUCL 33604]|uniref:Fungal-type protein kinase domain-containing protein n=1 Tax=Jaapia argillacea MUCL 33604 TaxID=933084 RepID=A0A067PIH3_9AGAM|nr:hypothetical protein JAAARDRAFT_196595 [Jaapia argillacea MUCL 33604]
MKTQVQRVKSFAKPGPNTTSIHYSWKDIKGVHSWPEFSFEHIMCSPYAQILARPVTGRALASCRKPFYDEVTLYRRFENILFCHLRCALRASLDPCPPGHSALTSDAGGTAQQKGFGLPDQAARYENKAIHASECPNRLPKEIKVSVKWNAKWVDRPVGDPGYKEYRQVLSQELYYMKSHHTRFGYLLTDTELVGLHRTPGQPGHLDVSVPIPITVFDEYPFTAKLGPLIDGAFPPARGKLTVLLALWYLHLLASDDSEWPFE